LKGASDSNDLLAAILRERGDLQKKIEKGEVKVNFPWRQGSRAYILFIGGEVFKGPRRRGDIFGLYKEARILKKLKGRGLPVPVITGMGRRSVFYSMTYLPGASLRSVLKNMTPEEKRLLAKDIADFTAGMASALPARGGRYARHADLHPDNILIDPATKRLAGILDFGEIKYHPKQALGENCTRHCPDSGLDELIRQEFALREARIPDRKRPLRLTSLLPLCGRRLG
jgi:aminoglycoside phosphotransferase (APT) family kinase protein